MWGYPRSQKPLTGLRQDDSTSCKRGWACVRLLRTEEAVLINRPKSDCALVAHGQPSIVSSSNMQLPTAPAPGVELQDAMQKLDISRDPRTSQQPPPQPQPRPQQQPQPAQSSRESSRATSDHHHHHQGQGRQSDSSQSAAQLDSALRASHEQVWYLKSIDFVSQSGASRKYNIILQNYNGCASFPPSLSLGC